MVMQPNDYLVNADLACGAQQGKNMLWEHPNALAHLV